MSSASESRSSMFLWKVLRAAVERQRPDGKSRPASPGAAGKAAVEKTETGPHPHKQNDAFRETIESVVIAFVLAFLFRTFLAEAFVIPTGSMAPTLMGRHKDFACTQCGHHFTVGASDEVDKESNLLIARLTTTVCPNCNFTNDIYDRPVFNGDRILVNKFPYEIGKPDRFDVFVFRYPEDPQTNYIKRLVGLPGESLRIERGDLYARAGAQGEFHILRKDDPNKQKVLQQTVYDDSLPPDLLLKHGWPERWASLRPNPSESGDPEWLAAEQGWTQDAVRRSFHVQAGADWDWLRYRHLTPSDQDWKRVGQGESPSAAPRPQLISDFCGYNAHRGRNMNAMQQWSPEAFWVGDLTLNASINVQKLSGTAPAVLLELVEGVRRYRCEFDLTTGSVAVSRSDEIKGDGSWLALGTSPSGIKGTGKHTVAFANVDDRLCLWIDGRLIPLGAEAEYASPHVRHPQTADLHPVGIAARDAEVEVSKLVIERDIYYRAIKAGQDNLAEGTVGRRLVDLLGDPAKYHRVYSEEIRSVEFDPLDDDEFFAMGDNSSRSYDGRLWHQTPQAHHPHAVNRRSLIGKAFFIYWPHGIPFLNDGKGFPVAMHGTPKPPPVENYPLYSAPFYPQWWRWSRIR